jgi:hypothetical protein
MDPLNTYGFFLLGLDDSFTKAIGKTVNRLGRRQSN